MVSTCSSLSAPRASRSAARAPASIPTATSRKVCASSLGRLAWASGSAPRAAARASPREMLRRSRRRRRAARAGRLSAACSRSTERCPRRPSPAGAGAAAPRAAPEVQVADLAPRPAEQRRSSTRSRGEGRHPQRRARGRSSGSSGAGMAHVQLDPRELGAIDQPDRADLGRAEARRRRARSEAVLARRGAPAPCARARARPRSAPRGQAHPKGGLPQVGAVEPQDLAAGHAAPARPRRGCAPRRTRRPGSSCAAPARSGCRAPLGLARRRASTSACARPRSRRPGRPGWSAGCRPLEQPVAADWRGQLNSISSVPGPGEIASEASLRASQASSALSVVQHAAAAAQGQGEAPRSGPCVRRGRGRSPPGTGTVPGPALPCRAGPRAGSGSARPPAPG